MESEDLKQKVEMLMSNGFDKDEIIKIATNTTIFTHKPEDIKSILNSHEKELSNLDITPRIYTPTSENIKSILSSHETSNEELLNIINNIQPTKSEEKKGKR